MIIVISHPGDAHATAVIDRLESGGHETFLLDYARFPEDQTLSVDYREHAPPVVEVVDPAGRSVTLSDATAVWWRRPQLVDVASIAADDARGFAYGEWHEALGALHELVPCPWMNSPPLDAAASRKTWQLTVARSLGLRVPRTLVPSDPGRARQFIDEVGLGRVVYKIFAATEQVWRETRRVTAENLEVLDTVRLAPVIFQELIPAVADIRVTVVGYSMFAMVIDSSDSGYDVDFRLNMARSRTWGTELPQAVADTLRALMKEFGLVYGAIDLRLTPDGQYVFLEVNPAGEFLFVEAGSGHPVTEAVADWLARPT